MRIAVEATCWHNKRGYGRHARALLRALISLDHENQYTLFLDSAEPAEPPPEGCEIRLVNASVPAAQAASANGRRSLADMWNMSRALSSSDFDLLLFPTVYTFVPTFSRARKLVMVHDVIAETFPQLTVPKLSARVFWNVKATLGRRQADALITVSNYARETIVKKFKIDPGRVFVVGEAADSVFRRLGNPEPTPALRQSGIEPTRRIIAYLGGFSPHKNLEALVTAFGSIAGRPEFRDVQLVMVGDTKGDSFHTYFGTIAAQVNSLNLAERVVFTGYLKDEDVVVLLNIASVLVLPSLMEGFGLPAVEAAACGCPVIATKASPLPELLPEGIFINSCAQEIEQALMTVLASEELRRQMGASLLAAAGRLTWDHAARQMLEVIRSVGRA